MKSIAQKIIQLSGLCGTGAVSDWEERFIHDIVIKSHNGQSTTCLTEKQVEKVDQIYEKHFG